MSFDVDDGLEYRKTATVKVRFATAPGIIHTLEGDHSYELGDAIAGPGAAGEFWPIRRDIFAATYALAVAQVPAQEERQVTALSGALSAVGDDLGEALRKSEIYRLGLAEAAARANTAEAQRDQAWRNLDTAYDDIAALLRESGLGDYARPVSTHDVIRDELLPWVRRAARALGVESKENDHD